MDVVGTCQILTFSHVETSCLHAEVADYMPIHRRVVFQPQDTEHNVTILIVGDNTLEDDEAFQLELSVPKDEPVTLLQPNHIAVINILNDDGKLCTIYMYIYNLWKFPTTSDTLL